MPRRTLLSSEQRTRLFGIPTEAAEVAKHYVLSAEDLALVRAKRRPNNRLGYAIQLCVLRHPGRPLEPSEVPPAAMLAFVANQVSADPKLFGDYAHRAETRREHLLELQPRLRLRSFRLADWRACLHVGANAAWATDRGEPIVQAMLAHLRAERVLIPVAAVLEQRKQIGRRRRFRVAPQPGESGPSQRRIERRRRAFRQSAGAIAVHRLQELDRGQHRVLRHVVANYFERILVRHPGTARASALRRMK
jgi:hypothetical protein